MLKTQDQDQLKQVLDDILKQAKQQGASAAEVSGSLECGFTTNVRLGEVDTVEYNQDKGLGVVVYFGQRKGAVSTTDVSSEAIHSTVKAACDIARFTEADPYAGLADASQMIKNIPDLDLCYPWQLSPEQAIDFARECETKGRHADQRISNSEGASVSTQQSFHVYANSHGFMGAFPTTSHSLSCALIAEHAGDMQRDYYYTVARDSLDLESLNKVAEQAVQRTVRRLGAQTIKTCQVPVMFEANIAGGLIGSFIGAIRGGALYRKTSFLVDHLGQQVFPNFVQIDERPHLLKGLGSAPFDGDGIATTEKSFIKDGVLQSYALGTYSARKLNMETTGNAGGVHNVSINHSDKDFDAMLKQMDKGILVTEVMGQGVNLTTGDYSRGASGFWVENGQIQYAIQEFTIAGNLKDMLANIVAVGNDIDTRGNIQCGSILLEQMTIAGN